MFKFILIALIALTSTGCSTVSKGLESTVHALEVLNQPRLSDNDSTNARWVQDSKISVALRTPKLFANSSTVRAMKSACHRGLSAEIIVYAGGAQEVSALKSSCIKVFVSDNPGTSKGFDVLLLDNESVVVEGNLVLVERNANFQEYYFRQKIKAYATRIN